MRDFILVFVAAFLASVLTYAIADRAASAQAHRAAVVTDEPAGAVRIVIDGREVVLVDQAGLHVAGNLTYSGVTTDTGSSGVPANTPQ